MCCLPNKFPLPIYLLINKCDKIDRTRRTPWLEKIQIETYIQENQFYNHFFISAEGKNDLRDTIQSSVSNKSVDINSPLTDIIKTIMNFKDIKEKLINTSRNKISKQTTKDSSRIGIEPAENTNRSKKDKNCNIL
jgi:hypothetical protein